jgi:cytochrome c-type biogenesis protein CcmH
MRRLATAACLLLAYTAGVVHAIDTEEAFDDPVMNERYRALIHEIRCMKCQNQSIADSPIDVAADLRRQVREMMASGRTDAEIKGFLASRYGDFILYQPPLKPSTWVLWGGPVALLGLGGLVFFRILRARSSQPIDEDGD